MSFRLLYQELLEYEGQATFNEVLSPWLQKNFAEIEWLKSIRNRAGKPIPELNDEELWRLYAVSRTFEFLAIRFQRDSAEGSSWPGFVLTLEELVYFAENVGFEVIQPNKFSPFYHEIVDLKNSQATKGSVQLENYYWPCLMLGPLLFMRAGVAVSADSNLMSAAIANKSKMYWTYQRKYKKCHDLAHGWGSNSSWRTSFRRDYCLDNIFHFNVDADNDLSVLPANDINHDGLNLEERIELVVNRSFVFCTKDDLDLCPYHDRVSLKAD